MLSTHRARVRRALLILALLAGVLLTACGSDDDGGATTAAKTTSAAADAFPITVQTKHGAVTIPEEPKRVVALDFPSADDAIALGVVPVGMAKVTYVPGFVQEWTKAALDGQQPELLEVDTAIPLEKVAALRPDLILATGNYVLDPVYDKLSKIAPVVGPLKQAGRDSWQDTATLIAQALGREEEGKRRIAEVTAKVRAARDAHPEFQGKTVAFFNYVEDLYVISEPDDFSIRFLSDLGFRLSPRIERMPAKDGRVQLSAERIGTLDADDVIVGTGPSATALRALERSALFERLPAVERGAYVSLPLGTATSIAFPSLLGVPFGIDTIVPKLADATA